jgi:hypothetical protein
MRTWTQNERREYQRTWYEHCQDTWTTRTKGPHVEIPMRSPYQQDVTIDVDLVPFIQRLWHLGVITYFSCQGRFTDHEIGLHPGYVVYHWSGHTYVQKAITEFDFYNPVYSHLRDDQFKAEFGPVQPKTYN